MPFSICSVADVVHQMVEKNFPTYDIIVSSTNTKVYNAELEEVLKEARVGNIKFNKNLTTVSAYEMVHFFMYLFLNETM